MWKAIIIASFALCVCWALLHVIDLNVVAFHLAGVSITYTMVVFCLALGFGYKLVRR